jgi:L-ascorbate metabolism protein UlaG (beta-lactamase superfamily)
MHYSTFDVIKADPHEFVRKVVALGRAAVVVDPGGEYQID